MSEGVVSRLEDWLRVLGFVENPFSQTEAESDPRLDEYFVEPACFDSVLGTAVSPQTAVLFAPRGGGKTANRVREAEQRLVACAEGSPRDLVLACNRLFATHVERFVTDADEDLRIGHKALDEAIEAFTRERARWRPVPSCRGIGFGLPLERIYQWRY